MLIFSHDSSSGQYWSKENNNAEVKHFGDSPTDAKYSRLDELETYGKENGAFQFKLEYPKVGITNIWKQTSNPVTATSRGVEGYEAISIEANSQNWGGLEYNDGNYNFIDGSVGTSDIKVTTACENAWLNLECSANAFVKINSAVYGRSDKTTCPNSAMSNTDCAASSSMDIVVDKCEGQESCIVAAANRIFGDPCGGTHKYLTVNYVCTSQGHYSIGAYQSWGGSNKFPGAPNAVDYVKLWVKTVATFSSDCPPTPPPQPSPPPFPSSPPSPPPSPPSPPPSYPMPSDIIKTAVDGCLKTNPVDGLCHDLKVNGVSYGAMPYWDTSQVTSLKYLFKNKVDFNADISGWDTSLNTKLWGTFQGAQNFNQDLSKWDTSKVNDFDDVFNGATKFTQDVSTWAWSCKKLQYSSRMYQNSGAPCFKCSSGIVFESCSTGRRRMLQSSDDTPPITDESFSGLISKCLAVAPTDGRCGEENEHGDMSMWNVSLVKDMTAAFKDKSNFNADLSRWNVFQVTSMEEMFSGASVFNSDIIGWETSEVVNMDSMFMDATEFNADITAWNTSSLTSSAGMFSGATAFADACVKITTTGSSSSDGPPYSVGLLRRSPARR